MTTHFITAEDLSALSDVVLLALCIWGEARGESLEGQVAVAHVVLNRAITGGWWGDSVREVILKEYQFSAFAEGGPVLNRLRREGLAGPMSSHKWMTYRTVAGMVLAGLTVDPTDGATHFHARWMTPGWAALMDKTTSIGGHIFYKEA